MTFESKLKRSVMLLSVEDVIEILENNPVRQDMIPQLNIARVMNRISAAHLSIERTMKFVITEAGGPLVKNHDLPSRLNELRQHEPSAAQFLEEAFTDAVQHYRYNPNASHMKHLQSLEKYLEATGSDQDFQDIRYWELDQSTTGILVRQIYLTLHMEILRAVGELLMPPGRTKETASLRVERAVQNAINSQNLAYKQGTEKELAVKSFLKWLKGFKSTSEAMTKALREGEAPDDEFAIGILRQVHQELTNSSDPAVKYFAQILTVLPSQPRDAKPCVEWLGPEKYQTGEVSTPGGDNLGFIFRRLDGLWNIQPMRDGLVTIAAIAATQTDARCFLGDILTKRAKATVNGNERELRIVGEEIDLLHRNHNQIAKRDEEADEPQFPTHEVVLWDNEHGISEGDNVKVEVPYREFNDVSHVLEGKVTGVTGPKVLVHGHDYIDSTEPNS